MRQIQVCASLLVISWFLAACGGDQFVAAEGGSPSNGSPPTGNASDGAGARSQAGGSASAGSGNLVVSPGDVNAGASPMSGAGGSAGSSGGLANAGGAGGTEAALAGAAAIGEDCPSGTIKFRMLPDPDLADGYLCDAGCGTGWLSITDAAGAMAYPLFSACGAASCDSCETLACSASACLPSPVTNNGVELEWTGTYMTKDTCGANVACQRATCVKPGRYRAKACAAVSGGASTQNGIACTPKAEQVCAVAEFDFPANDTIKLVLKK